MLFLGVKTLLASVGNKFVKPKARLFAGLLDYRLLPQSLISTRDPVTWDFYTLLQATRRMKGW
jgi:hypothetical protein